MRTKLFLNLTSFMISSSRRSFLLFNEFITFYVPFSSLSCDSISFAFILSSINSASLDCRDWTSSSFSRLVSSSQYCVSLSSFFKSATVPFCREYSQLMELILIINLSFSRYSFSRTSDKSLFSSANSSFFLLSLSSKYLTSPSASPNELVPELSFPPPALFG